MITIAELCKEADRVLAEARAELEKKAASDMDRFSGESEPDQLPAQAADPCRDGTSSDGRKH